MNQNKIREAVFPPHLKSDNFTLISHNAHVKYT